MAKVLYFNNCWFTNVGEAFIDIGGMELTKCILGQDIEMACISDMSSYYIDNAPGVISDFKAFLRRFFGGGIAFKERNRFRLENYIDADYIILPGQVGTTSFLESPARRIVDKLKEKGCQVIFIGLGSGEYNEDEAAVYKKWLDHIKPSLIISRDNETYETYKDVAPCIKGIDGAFWCIDKFDPRGMAYDDYEVITFNRTPEPKELKKHVANVVRPWHMQYQYRRKNYNDNILISDTPYDYLTVYANAKRVYTDLVHASIVSLMYGVPVKYYYVDKRSKAFFAIDNLQIEDGWMKVSEADLLLQKKRVIEEAREVL